jgi:hypothetical protein
VGQQALHGSELAKSCGSFPRPDYNASPWGTVNESGIYTEADLKPYQSRLAELKLRNRERESGAHGGSTSASWFRVGKKLRELPSTFRRRRRRRRRRHGRRRRLARTRRRTRREPRRHDPERRLSALVVIVSPLCRRGGNEVAEQREREWSSRWVNKRFMVLSLCSATSFPPRRHRGLTITPHPGGQ